MKIRKGKEHVIYDNTPYKLADGIFIVAGLCLAAIAVENLVSLVRNLREQTSIPKRYNDAKKS